MASQWEPRRFARDFLGWDPFQAITAFNTMTGNRLTISGKRDAEREGQTDAYYMYERAYGDFSRSFTLPSGVDTNNIEANLESGVLAVTVKKIPQPVPRKISVQSRS